MDVQVSLRILAVFQARGRLFGPGRRGGEPGVSPGSSVLSFFRGCFGQLQRVFSSEKLKIFQSCLRIGLVHLSE